MTLRALEVCFSDPLEMGASDPSPAPPPFIQCPFHFSPDMSGTQLVSQVRCNRAKLPDQNAGREFERFLQPFLRLLVETSQNTNADFTIFVYVRTRRVIFQDDTGNQA